ncbi:unnamed protein product [Leptidea sinapis]|uniref:Uncharacterized protein n=1 Tax=Leptidea sinapis TaxID=189913 RepID=A0A5E4PKZ9_9NEOP|nr:unnamed protein product [Leptidea sinapis]
MAKMSKIKKLTGSFRYTQWDPCLIISQIIAMQFIMYLTLCILIAIMQDLTVIGAYLLWLLVGRTKLCLDFSCWMYNAAPPTTFSWWVLNIACTAITCVAGEFLCLRTELQAIPLSNIGAKVDL